MSIIKIRTCFIGLLLLVIFGACSGNKNPSITIANNTGYPVSEVYISQTASEYWGNNLVRRGNMADGASSDFRLPFAIDVVNRYDIRLVDTDGDTYTRKNVLVSSGESLAFTFADFDFDNISSFNGPPVIIVNNTGYPVLEVYISPADADSWGQDRLADGQILSSGESLTLNLPLAVETMDTYDIRLVDSDGDSYVQWDLQVSPDDTIVFTFDDIEG